MRDCGARVLGQGAAGGAASTMYAGTRQLLGVA
jgi:hypothetical protein